MFFSSLGRRQAEAITQLRQHTLIQPMNKAKGKRGGATRISVIHGDQNSWLHYIHAKESKERQKIAYVAHEVMDGTDYPKFKSDLSALGDGRNWIRKNGKLNITPGKKWVELMFQLIDDCSWFHQRMRSLEKEGKNKGKHKIRYVQRYLNDRKVLSKTDEHSRPKTDLLRETVDMRPDHSRALQYLLEDGRKNDLIPILAEIQEYQITLFETIYEGRKIVSEGEHVDSGQYHFDHWHTGIAETEVDDHGAVVKLVGKGPDKDKAEELQVAGKKEKFWLRTPFNIYGVSDGMASFDRHRRALEDDGRNAKDIMGFTHEKLLGNIELVQEKNKKRLEKRANRKREDVSEKDIMPRDIRMWRQVDEFVDRKLRELDPELCDKARKEYADWLQHGYELEKLGIRRETLEVTKHKKRKHELAILKSAVRAFLELILAIPGVMQLLKASDRVWAKVEEISVMVAPENEEDLATEDKARKGLEGPSMD